MLNINLTAQKNYDNEKEGNKIKNDYEKELAIIHEEWKKEIQVAMQESERLYNKIATELGHTNLLANSINEPLSKCNKKYQDKISNLKEKYKIELLI